MSTRTRPTVGSVRQSVYFAAVQALVSTAGARPRTDAEKIAQELDAERLRPAAGPKPAGQEE